MTSEEPPDADGKLILPYPVESRKGMSDCGEAALSTSEFDAAYSDVVYNSMLSVGFNYGIVASGSICSGRLMNSRIEVALSDDPITCLS